MNGGFWIGGQFIPPGLMQFSHSTPMGDVYVPRDLPTFEPGTSALTSLLEAVSKPMPKVDWLADD